MHSLTWEEKIATFSMLIMIMKADDVVLQPEIDYLNYVSDMLGLTIDDIDKVDSFDYESCKVILSSMSSEGKDTIMQMLNEMAISDGYLDPREKKIIESLIL